jgi:hypothetical protein
MAELQCGELEEDEEEKRPFKEARCQSKDQDITVCVTGLACYVWR